MVKLGEHPELSLSHLQLLYKALYIGSDIPTMSARSLELVLECLCAHFNLERLKPERKGQKFEAWNFAMDVGMKWRNQRLEQR